MRSSGAQIEGAVDGRSTERPIRLPPVDAVHSRLVGCDDEPGDDLVDSYWVTPAPKATSFWSGALGLHDDAPSRLARQGVLATLGFALAVVAVVVATPEQERLVVTAAGAAPTDEARIGIAVAPAEDLRASRLRASRTTTSSSPARSSAFSMDDLLIGGIVTDASIGSSTTTTEPERPSTTTTEAPTTTAETVTVPDPTTTTVAPTTTTEPSTTSSEPASPSTSSTGSTVASSSTTSTTTSSSTSSTTAPTTESTTSS